MCLEQEIHSPPTPFAPHRCRGPAIRTATNRPTDGVNAVTDQARVFAARLGASPSTMAPDAVSGSHVFAFADNVAAHARFRARRRARIRSDDFPKIADVPGALPLS
jgi:hypothetical protein